MSNRADTGRSYAGESAADRTQRRRRQLLDAGREAFGTDGYAKATVRALCARARVADRYFYAEFAGTEDLLLAVYAECLQVLEDAVVGAVGGLDEAAGVHELAEAGLTAFLDVVQRDPRLARIVWIEVLGVSPRVTDTYMAGTRAFADLLTRLLDERSGGAGVPPEPPSPAVGRELVSYALAGGISQTVLRWMHDDFALDRDDLVAGLVGLLMAGAELVAGGDGRLVAGSGDRPLK